MTTPPLPRSTLVRLIGLGLFQGTPVAELRPGDTLLSNFGYRSEVVGLEQSKGTKTVLLKIHDSNGQLFVRRKAATTLVVLYACGTCVADPAQPSRCERCGRRLASPDTAQQISSQLKG